MNKIIAAVATASSVGGISIIRLSGDDVLNICRSYFKIDISNQSPNTIVYNHFIYQNQYIDEVLVSFFKNPRSFTGEDVIEINCHGGVIITRHILEILLNNPYIRLATPGEFSKRAFLNGKKTLQASKAIEEIITAPNLIAMQMSQQKSQNVITLMIETLRSKLLDIVANIEVNIDYPEYEDINQVKGEKIINPARDFVNEIDSIIYNSLRGEIIKSGIDTAIIGAPNVGKSSLLNLLSNNQKAIVTDIAGTTRDIVESQVLLGNINLNLMDTAGIRKTSDIVEKIGIDKSYQAASTANLVLFLVDQSREISLDEINLYNTIKNKPHVVIITKRDLEQVADLSNFEDYIKISTKNNEDINEIEKAISEIFDLVDFDPLNSKFVVGLEDISLLKQARSYIVSAVEQLEMEMPIDIIEIDIKEALFVLGKIIDIDPEKNLIDELFSRFCLGK